MASKRRIRRNACGSKKKYASKKDALSAALEVKRRVGDKGFVNAYQCTFCKQFHWGHS